MSREPGVRNDSASKDSWFVLDSSLKAHSDFCARSKSKWRWAPCFSPLASVFLMWRILDFLWREGTLCPTHYIHMKLSPIIAFAKNQNKQINKQKAPWTDSNTKPYIPLLSVNPSGAMTHDLVWFPSYISSLQRLQLPLRECSQHLHFCGWHDCPDLCSWVATINFM